MPFVRLWSNSSQLHKSNLLECRSILFWNFLHMKRAAVAKKLNQTESIETPPPIQVGSGIWKDGAVHPPGVQVRVNGAKGAENIMSHLLSFRPPEPRRHLSRVSRRGGTAVSKQIRLCRRHDLMLLSSAVFGGQRAKKKKSASTRSRVGPMGRLIR